MKISYRDITEKDFPFLMTLYRTTRDNELSQTNLSEDEKQKFVEFQFRAQHSYYKQAYEGAEMKLILWDKRPVGRLYLWRTESQIRIMDISLMPEHRGMGTGTKILKTLIRESIAKNKKLNIHVEYFNPARRLYERLGFTKIDDTGVYLFMEREPVPYSKKESLS